MFKSITLTLLMILLGLSACSTLGFAPQSDTSTSGIEGYVTLGPICPGPVKVGDLNCHDKPYEAKISVLDSKDQLVTRFDSDETGYFKVNLPPGIYTIRPESDNSLPFAKEQTVSVAEGQYTPVSIIYDTGIR